MKNEELRVKSEELRVKSGGLERDVTIAGESARESFWWGERSPLVAA